MKNLIHGGDLDIIEKELGIKKEEIIDFSGNINPFGISSKIKSILKENLHIIETYPDKDYFLLKNSISEYVKSSFENIIVGNGATELISLFLKIISPLKSLIISPSYSEYEKELKKLKSEISYFNLKEEENFILNTDSLIKNINNQQIVILCNPNNPTGTAIDINNLEKIARHCQKNNIFFMIDETYAEFTNFKDNISAIGLAQKFDNIFIIRGTSKFFAIPGARLGYAICSNKDLLERINQEKDPWSVNSFANLIGINIFKDLEFIENTQNLIFNEREKFFKEIDKIHSLKFYKSKSNFILCKILNEKTSDYVFENLIKEKILIRNAQNFQFLNNKYFRFCILKPHQNELLLNKLINILK